ncbi:MAG: hypothetical protein JRC68_08400 [Deltaproteobacteria bacterium]|nr:hypothetical protein [Deltaproteobacteria bacterium]
MRTFRTNEIKKLTKVPKDQIVYWSRVGMIKAYEDNRGRGKRKIYNWVNLMEILICRELNKVNISTELMAKILEFLRNEKFLLYRSENRKQKPKKCSFWELIEVDPKTEFTFLVINYKKSGDFPFGVIDRVALETLMEKSAFMSIIIVNIRELIKEVS